MSEAYHLGELKIAQDPDNPDRILPPPVPAGTRVLDVGCGAGQTLAVAYPELESFGLDVDLGALTFGQRQIAPKVRFTAGRAEQLPFADRQFDLVVARVSLAYTNIPESLKEIHRVLKPEGKLWMVLHPLWVPWASAKKSNWKGKVFFTYIVLNGLAFHCFGRVHRFFGRYESFQTEHGIKRVLQRTGFNEVKIERGRHFLVTARSTLQVSK